MKVSHKVCKTTQNFVKKKLKAFPSRLDGFYTTQTWCYYYGLGDVPSTRKHFGMVRTTWELDATVMEMLQKLQKQWKTWENTIGGNTCTSSASTDQQPVKLIRQ